MNDRPAFSAKLKNLASQLNPQSSKVFTSTKDQAVKINLKESKNMSEQATAAEQITIPKHGEFCWNELSTKNLESCKPFYSELLGWKFKDNTPIICPDGNEMVYSEISIDGQKQFGGMFQMGKEFGETSSHWMSYIAVDDVDATAKKVKELGGNICVPPTNIPNTGRFSVVQDPAGATFSVITLNGGSEK